MFKRMVIVLGLVLTLTVPVPVWVLAQTVINNDGTTLKQIIIFGRHSIRSATTATTTLDKMAVDPYPPFERRAGLFDPAWEACGSPPWRLLPPIPALRGTSDGQRSNRCSALVFPFQFHRALMGNSRRIWDRVDPELTVPVHSFPIGQPDPVFDPIAANVAKVDPVRAATQVQEIFNSGAALTSAYSGEYSLIRSVLFDYPLGTQPPPPTPSYCPQSSHSPCTDPTAQAITLTPNTTSQLYTGGVINVGGLSNHH